MRRVVLSFVFLLPALASAHQASVTYSSVDIGGDGHVRWSIKIATRDLYEALVLDSDRDATDAEIRAGADALFGYVLQRVAVTADGAPCPPSEPHLTLISQTQRFAEMTFVAACPLPLRKVKLSYDLFFDLDPRHTGMAVISHGERTVRAELTRGMSSFEWALDLAPPASLGAVAYVWEGMQHIYTGYDHIAFVIGLVLIAAVRRRELRPFREAGRYVLKIVTAFTIAHSITLILAALDVVSLPGRLVESAIAASIVYVAVENIAVAEPRHRWPLAFLFGLVHGLGFAAMLRPLLPPNDVIVPLLLFNLGVEIGQLSIVAPLLVVLWLTARADTGRYRRSVIVGGSALMGMFGLYWLVVRILDVRALF